MKKTDLAGIFKKRTGYGFKDPKALHQALTHSSQTRPGGADNERLEFLGDRVLALAISDWLFAQYPDADEGKMARRLNAMVRKETCARVARKIGIGDMMQAVSQRPSRKDSLFESTNVLGDACEAVIAAVYLEAGYKRTARFVLKLWEDELGREGATKKDPKSALQEWALARGLGTPQYHEENRTGPDHAPLFEMSVSIEGFDRVKASGPAKQTAEQAAAQAFMEANDV